MYSTNEIHLKCRIERETRAFERSDIQYTYFFSIPIHPVEYILLSLAIVIKL